MDTPRRAVTFIVHVFPDASGQVLGSVQRARTGERRPFRRPRPWAPLIVEISDAERARMS